MAEEIPPQQQVDIAVQQALQAKQPDAPRDIQEMLAKYDLPIIPKPDQEDEEEKKAKKSEPEPLTDEEITKASEALGEKLGFNRKDKKTEKKEEKKPDETPAETKADAETTDKPDPTPKGKKVKVTRKEPTLDPADLAALTAARTAKAIADELKQAPQTRTQAPDPLETIASNLLDDEKEDLKVYQQMAQDNPAYQDLPRQYLQSIQRIEAYKNRWERENPGSQFNPDDEAHDEFYATNTPQVNQRDFRKAEVRLEAKTMVEKKDRETQAERIAERAEQAVRDLAPTINDTKLNAAVTVLKTLDEKFLPLVEKEGFEKFAEQEPIAADALKLSATRLDKFLTAARQFDDPKGRIPYNQNDPGHVEYGNYLLHKEAELSKRPLRDRTDDDGRVFLPRHEYLKLPANKRGDYWFLDADKLIEMRVEEEAEFASNLVKKETEKLEKLAKLRGWSTANNEKSDKSPKEEKKEKAADTTQIQSPSAGAGGKVDAMVKGDANSDNSFWERSATILFQR